MANRNTTEFWITMVVLDITIMSLYMIIGVIGNTLVLVVYWKGLMNISEERYFIPILAVSDLIACIVCCSLSTTWDLMQITFTNTALCKFIYYIIGNTTYMSGFLLLCIAIQRYLKICRKRTLGIRWRRRLVLVAFLLSVACSIPLALKYGIVDFYSDGEIIGKRCGKLKLDSKITGAAYGIACAVVIVFSASAFIILYGKISCFIFGHLRTQTFKKAIARLSRRSIPFSIKGINDSTGLRFADRHIHVEQKHNDIYNFNDSGTSLSSNTLGISESSGSLTSKARLETSSSEQKAHFLAELSKSQKYVNEMEITSKNSIETQNPDETQYSERRTENSSNNKLHMWRNRRLKYRFTIMFMVITIVFLLCYSPVGTLLLLEGFFPDFWERLTSTETSVILVLYHSYIINNIANPFIYAFMDPEFYKKAKTVL
ncbi:CCKAR [Mytilus coruscus]|uniref:CCKAR n=1 Tax=Mytilus coruscus TaxID=42192 RepID=A0A6J8A1S6_MYTCO|nr:CCKAR [Mytilus coruscus]